MHTKSIQINQNNGFKSIFELKNLSQLSLLEHISPVKTEAPAITGAPDFAEDLIFLTEEPLPELWPELRRKSPAGGPSVSTLLIAFPCLCLHATIPRIP